MKNQRLIVYFHDDEAMESFYDDFEESIADDMQWVPMTLCVYGDIEEVLSDPRVRDASVDRNDRKVTQTITPATFAAANGSWALARAQNGAQPLVENGGGSWLFNCNVDGAGVDIYVFDSGVFAAHQDFGGRCIGLPSDIWNNPTGQDLTPSAGDAHGTVMASCAAGAVAGPAKGARIYGMKFNFFSELTAGLAAIAEHHARKKRGDYGTFRPSVACCSSGFGQLSQSDYDNAKSILMRLIGEGVFWCAPSSNQSINNMDMVWRGGLGQTAPDAISGRGILCGSLGQRDTMNSGYGECVDFHAGADGIYFADHTTTSTSEYGRSGGSSFAGPFLAGVIALHLQVLPYDMQTNAVIRSRLAAGATRALRGAPVGSAHVIQIPTTVS